VGQFNAHGVAQVLQEGAIAAGKLKHAAGIVAKAQHGPDDAFGVKTCPRLAGSGWRAGEAGAGSMGKAGRKHDGLCRRRRCSGATEVGPVSRLSRAERASKVRSGSGALRCRAQGSPSVSISPAGRP
jgi:hypothetical protein